MGSTRHVGRDGRTNGNGHTNVHRHKELSNRMHHHAKNLQGGSENTPRGLKKLHVTAQGDGSGTWGKRGKREGRGPRPFSPCSPPRVHLPLKKFMSRFPCLVVFSLLWLFVSCRVFC